jgi:hypothetical protein
MAKFEEFKAKLRPGRTYRRADLAQWSTAVDRHLKEAVQAGVLTKLAGGLYYAPRQTAFGMAPPEDDTLVATFLKGGPFLLASPTGPWSITTSGTASSLWAAAPTISG